ncbi:MAG: peptide MFS transporter, partial [Gammaproteobacteria bacterium]|nr:peptide MFS transporter [Gammaproteobacteria bacterium]
SIIVTDLFGDSGVQSSFLKTVLTMSNDGSRILPEGMININAFLIMTTCFLLAAFSGKFRVTTAMLMGAIASCATMALLGMTAGAWTAAFAIALFSVGEMLISPKKNEFMGNIAPEGKKAMYLGFVMLPQGIGWTLEGYWGPRLYEIYASKDIFAKELLAERGMSISEIAAIPQGEGFSTLVRFTGETAQSLTQFLYQTHNVGMAWYIIGGIGSLSAVGIFLYGRWLYKLQQQ